MKSALKKGMIISNIPNLARVYLKLTIKYVNLSTCNFSCPPQTIHGFKICHNFSLRDGSEANILKLPLNVLCA